MPFVFWFVMVFTSSYTLWGNLGWPLSCRTKISTSLLHTTQHRNAFWQFYPWAAISNRSVAYHFQPYNTQNVTILFHIYFHLFSVQKWLNVQWINLWPGHSSIFCKELFKMRELQFSTKTQKHASFKPKKISYNRNAISYFIHSRRTSWSADLNTSQSTPNPPYYFTPNSKSTNSTFIISIISPSHSLWILQIHQLPTFAFFNSITFKPSKLNISPPCLPPFKIQKLIQISHLEWSLTMIILVPLCTLWRLEWVWDRFWSVTIDLHCWCCCLTLDADT